MFGYLALLKVSSWIPAGRMHDAFGFGAGGGLPVLTRLQAWTRQALAVDAVAVCVAGVVRPLRGGLVGVVRAHRRVRGGRGRKGHRERERGEQCLHAGHPPGVGSVRAGTLRRHSRRGLAVGLIADRGSLLRTRSRDTKRRSMASVREGGLTRQGRRLEASSRAVATQPTPGASAVEGCGVGFAGTARRTAGPGRLLLGIVGCGGHRWSNRSSWTGGAGGRRRRRTAASSSSTVTAGPGRLMPEKTCCGPSRGRRAAPDSTPRLRPTAT
jgi:hypothetical protein